MPRFRRIIGAYLSVLLLFTVVLRPAEASNVTPDTETPAILFGPNKTLEEAYLITQKILKAYPPERYHYIFVGRSLSLIKVMMDSMHISNTGLPFSGKNFDLTFSSIIAAKQAQWIRNHLDQHLPKESIRQGKELVLLDFTSSGAGLITAQKILNWYYNQAERLHLVKVTTNIASLSSLVPNFMVKNSSTTIRISSDSMFAMQLRNSNFDAYAGYGTFNIETGKYLHYDEHTRARYQGLRAWVTEVLYGNLPGLKLRCSRHLRAQ